MKPAPRPKLRIHQTSRDLSPPPREKGRRIPFVIIAIVFMVALTQLFPDWWFPKPRSAKPVTVPIERNEGEWATIEKIEVGPPVETAEPAPTEREPYGPPTPAKKPLWMQNAVPVTLQPGKAYVAIVIDDMGVNVPKSREMLDLPSVLTLSFLPYARNVGAMAKEARGKGHEIMVHIPMEPMNGELDTGRDVLLTGMRNDEMRRIIDTNLAQLDGYVGVNNHMGSKFTQDEAAMAELATILKERGLTFLDSKTIAASKGFDIARGMGLPAAERDVFLDNDPALPEVQKQLARLEKIALKKGHAIAIGHPKADTITALREWLKQADAKGIQIVPYSALVEQ